MVATTVLLLCTLLTLAPAADVFTSSWSGGKLYGRLPPSIIADANLTSAEDGGAPLFLWVTGTSCWFDTPSDEQTTAQMASRGFVSVQVQYSNSFYPQTCDAFMAKAKPMFDPKASRSVTAVLCARSDVDCGKGIALFGFSQGAQLCSLGKYYDERVSAAFLIGHGTAATDYQDFTACMSADSKYRSLPNNKVRQMNGEHDEVFGCTLDKDDNTNASGGVVTGTASRHACTRPSVREQLTVTSGVSCATGNDCLQPDGSGWRAVLDAEARGRNGKADHIWAWKEQNPCYIFNPNFQQTSADFQLGKDLDWLAAAARM